MKLPAWRLLQEELDLEIATYEKYNDAYLNTCRGECSLVQYSNLISDLTNDFITECRHQLDFLGHTPSCFSDLLLKLNISFHTQFGIDFPDGEIPYPLLYRELEVPAVNTSRDPYISVVHSRIHGFSFAISFLREHLNSQIPVQTKHRIRVKANIRDFRATHLKARQLSEILRSGKRLGLFSPDMNPKDFIDIFSGRPTANRINWTCTIYSLTKFINGINGHAINKLTDGKWLVISQLFIVDGHEVQENSLLHSGAGKNDELENVDRLIDYFNSPDEFDD